MKKDCKKHFKQISEYLDGEMDIDIAKKIEAHLLECPQCRDCVDSLKRTIRLCKEASKETMPEEIRTRLHSTLKQCIEQDKRAQ